MNRKYFKYILYPMLFLALLALALFYIFLSNLTYRENLETARRVAQVYDGQSTEEIDRLISLQGKEDSLTEGILVTRLDDDGTSSEESFKDGAGNTYIVEAQRPTALQLLSQLWLPILTLLAIAALISWGAIKRLRDTETGPVQSMVDYLKSLLSGSFNENTDYTQVEKELVALLGSEKQKTAFKEALSQVRENETLRRQFSANVSHELKSPLTSINGYAEMIESGMAGPHETQKFASIIHREGVRLLNMINEIIQLSKFDTGYSDYDERAEFSMTQRIKDEIQSISVHASNRNLKIHFDSPDIRLFGNERLLADVVRNLLSNAVKYSKVDGGNIYVSLKEEGDTVRLVIEDEGLGISKEDQNRVFERFYVVDKARNKKQGSGTGLGLSLVKHTVQSHGGQVLLDSKLGHGSKFTIILPKYGLREE